MKIALLVVGLVLIAFGLHWIGQGTGLFIWPGNPVMNNHVEWAYYGAVVAVVGAAMIWFARR